MPQHVIFAAPFFMDAILRFNGGATRLPDVALTGPGPGPRGKRSAELWTGIAGHRRVGDALDARQPVDGTRNLERQLGRARRMIGTLEPLQAPLAAARARLGLEGPGVDAAMNFREQVAHEKSAVSRRGALGAACVARRPPAGRGPRDHGRRPDGGKATVRNGRHGHLPPGCATDGSPSPGSASERTATKETAT